MKKNSVNVVWRSLLFYSFVVSGILIFKCDRAFSQITPDSTLGAESSTVNPRDANSESIDGGAVRGQNLFHSFQEFNVGEDRGVYFANPNAVSNIFSRVTGSNVSNILGTLGVDGAANLYLINPNGIVFGENSSLDVQGSFTATTADAIEFSEGGLFSAVAPGESLLTISVPLGLQFGSTPGSIINRSFVQDETEEFVGLQVLTGENLTLVGGEIRFEAGEATARGGNVNIGGLGAAGTVDINDDDTLSFPDDVERADVTFNNAADVDVRGMGGGNINLHARNAFIEVGDFGSSQIRAGIDSDSISPEAQAGNINIDTTDNLSVADSTILNKVDFQAVGNAGNINIDTGSLTLNDGGRISTTTEGTGNAGEINITASNSIIIDGISADLDECVFCENSDGSNSGVFSLVTSDALGSAGRITISANSLTLTNGGRIDATTLSEGNSGKIDIIVTEDITVNGADVDPSDITGNFFDPDFLRDSSIALSPSGIFSRVNSTATGNAEGIAISANTLDISNRGEINASISGQGNSGEIDIVVTDDITINNSGGISSLVNSEGVGNAGDIIISTRSLAVTDAGRINASTLGEGNAGDIKITATDSIAVDGTNSDGFISFISSGVFSEAIGNGGNLTIDTNRLIVKDGGVIVASTLSDNSERGGNLKINATESVEVLGTTEESNSPSSISTETQSSGIAGNLQISTQRLSILDGGTVNANTSGSGRGGSLTIDAFETVEIIDGSSDGQFSSSISADTRSSGNAGNITIETRDLVAEGGGFVGSAAREGSSGNAGNITIDVSNSIELIGLVPERNRPSGISAAVSPNGSGDGGNVFIETRRLSIKDGAGILVNNLGSGQAGILTVNATDSVEMFGTSGGGDLNVASGFDATGEGGNLTIETGRLSIRDGSRVFLNTLGEADAGRIEIKASDSIEITGISLDTQLPSQIDASSGLIPDLIDDSLIQFIPGFTGEGGDIVIQTASLNLSNGAQINAAASGSGDAGNIFINVDELLAVTGGNISTETLQSSGELSILLPKIFAFVETATFARMLVTVSMMEAISP